MRPVWDIFTPLVRQDRLAGGLTQGTSFAIIEDILCINVIYNFANAYLVRNKLYHFKTLNHIFNIHCILSKLEFFFCQKSKTHWLLISMNMKYDWNILILGKLKMMGFGCWAIASHLNQTQTCWGGYTSKLYVTENLVWTECASTI